MREIYEQILAIFWITIHHRWLVAFAAALICLIGWTVVYLLPDQYQVKTVIYFDSETALSPVLENIAIEDKSREERALIIQRTLTNRSSLQAIAIKSGKLTETASEQKVNKTLYNMFKNLKVTSTALNQFDEYAARSLFTITYLDQDPEDALKVVQALQDDFIDRFIGTGRNQSGQVEGFLDEKIEEYKKQLEVAEEKLKLFKQENPNLTQVKGENFFTRLNDLKSKLEEARLQLVEEENRNFTLRNQLGGVISDSRSSEGAAIKAQELSLIEQRIREAEIELDELRLQFTDRHPDVLAAERILRQLQVQKAEEDKNPQAITRRSASLVKSELYQKLQLMVSESNSKLSALRARITEYQSKLTVMEQQVTVMPEIEAELVRLTRDYTVTKETYDSLVQRRASSEISTEAEMTNLNMLYEVLEPPEFPAGPVAPDRILLGTAILFAGLIGGIALAWLLEQFRPKIYREQQIKDLFDLPVYGNVPMHWSTTEIASRRIGAVFYCLFLAALISCYYMVMVEFGFSFEPYKEKIEELINQEAA